MEWLTRFTGCVCFSLSPWATTFHQRTSRIGFLFFPPFSPPANPSFLLEEMRPDAAKYILVWRWTDKSFSIDRLKYKLRFQRFQRPPPHTRIRDNSSAFHRSLLSSKGVPRRFPHLKSVPSVCYYYYSCLFVTLF